MIYLKAFIGLMVILYTLLQIGCTMYSIYCLYVADYSAGFLSAGIALVLAHSLDMKMGKNNE